MKSMVQQLTSGGLAKGHKAVAGAGDDDEEDGPTKGENPLLLQAVMSAASTAQEEEDEVPEEAEEFEDEEDYLSILTKDDDSDAMARTFSTLAEFGNASHPLASKVPRPPKRKIACPQYRANQPQLTHTPTQASLPHSQYRRSGSPTNSSLYSVSQAFSPPSEGSTNPVVVQVSPGQKSPVHRLPPATFPPCCWIWWSHAWPTLAERACSWPWWPVGGGLLPTAGRCEAGHSCHGVYLIRHVYGSAGHAANPSGGEQTDPCFGQDG